MGWDVVGDTAAVGCELVHPDKITIATSRAKQRKIALFRMIRTYSLLSD
jgi:hypothetical protein